MRSYDITGIFSYTLFNSLKKNQVCGLETIKSVEIISFERWQSLEKSLTEPHYQKHGAKNQYSYQH